jgi:hypothetical protein
VCSGCCPLRLRELLRRCSTEGDHINVGVYGNFFRLADSGIDLGGVGARLSVSLMPRVQLEAESVYNFEAAYTQGFSDANGTVSVSRSHVRTLDGLFGPKIYTNKGPVRLFATAKGGFINFNLATSPAVTLQTVNSAFQGINGANTLRSILSGRRRGNVPGAYRTARGCGRRNILQQWSATSKPQKAKTQPKSKAGGEKKIHNRTTSTEPQKKCAN